MALSWCHCNALLSLNKKTAAPLSLDRRSKYSGQSVRAIPMSILTVGKKRSQGIQLLVEEYKEKIKYYCSIEDNLIRSNRKITSDVNVQIEAEDTIMMQQIKPEDLVVMLDENGKDIVSEQMADLVGDTWSTADLK